jgi:hypothetical protein
MKRFNYVVVLLAVVLLSANALADHCDKDQCPLGKTCDTDKCEGCPDVECASFKTSTAAKQPSCPIEAAMAKLPKMVYKIDGKTACCPKSAVALADKSGSTVKYGVADKTFDNERLAFVALVEATEHFVDDFATPRKCKVSGTTSVAGKSCRCPVEAQKTARLVKSAMEKVAITFVVGEKECKCPTEAKRLAEESGAETFYVVNGEKSKCNYHARLNLARAKYRASVEALAKAENGAKGAS